MFRAYLKAAANPPITAKITLPDSPSNYYWISGNGMGWQHSTSGVNYHTDCGHWTRSSSSYLGMLYIEANATWPYGSATWDTCNASYPILCCR